MENPEETVLETPLRQLESGHEGGSQTVEVMEQYSRILRSGDSASSVDVVMEEFSEDPENTQGNAFRSNDLSFSADRGEPTNVSESGIQNPYSLHPSHGQFMSDLVLHPGDRVSTDTSHGAPAPISSSDVGADNGASLEDSFPGRRHDAEVVSRHDNPLEYVADISPGESNNHISFQQSNPQSLPLDSIVDVPNGIPANLESYFQDLASEFQETRPFESDMAHFDRATESNVPSNGVLLVGYC